MTLDLAVITPVGPGHEDVWCKAWASVDEAVKERPDIGWGMFTEADSGEGRSAVRNRLVERARGRGAEWLFFLDADDEMLPEAVSVWRRHAALYDAIWGSIKTNTEGVRDGQEYPMTYGRIVHGHPARTINIGFFIKADKMVEFDEGMDCGEDYKAYLELWHPDSGVKCYKSNTPIYLNNRGNHSTGPRAKTGRDWRLAVERLQREAAQEMKG